MFISFFSIIMLIIGLIYFTILPGYVLLDALRINGLDVIEMITVSFGVGLIVLTGEAIALSIVGSLGLTAQNLIIFTSAFVIIVRSLQVLKKKFININQI
ncbi:MAG TPA: hypothetical protein VED16_03205 [Candidatus Acidoferrum sp.]|nr:hypothetical protein [Candidatus Acidoferrum sp.]